MSTFRGFARLNPEALETRFCPTSVLGDGLDLGALPPPPLEGPHVRVFDGVTTQNAANALPAVDVTSFEYPEIELASRHAGGANFSFGDGSVRFVSDGIAPNAAPGDASASTDLAAEDTDDGTDTAIGTHGYIRIKKLNSGG